jgi:electron transfer flavoprotein beta subunit
MEILVCVKRVPTVGGKITLTADGQQVDTRMSGFTISPHEECAVEEAVQLTERLGGTVTVLTLGPPEAAEQVRDCMALGAGAGVLLEAGDQEWGPAATADAIAGHVTRRIQFGGSYDLLLFGNEAADTGDYQVPVRVAHQLGLPCVTGIKHLDVQADAGGEGQRIIASREYRGVEETFSLPLPAVVSVKEGINLPRYPSLPGRLRAKRASLEKAAPAWHADGVRTLRLRLPDIEQQNARVLGTGTEAVPALVGLLDELGVLS